MQTGLPAASFDRQMMALVLIFSSSEPARAAAAAWLSAFDRARANGVAEPAALGIAAAAAARLTGDVADGSGMLPPNHARPPPAAA